VGSSQPDVVQYAPERNADVLTKASLKASTADVECSCDARERQRYPGSLSIMATACRTSRELIRLGEGAAMPSRPDPTSRSE
jgi:hypothetical protein